MLQVFQLDCQYSTNVDGTQLPDDSKSYVFLIYSPQSSASNTAAPSTSASASAAGEDAVLIARYSLHVISGVATNLKVEGRGLTQFFSCRAVPLFLALQSL